MNLPMGWKQMAVGLKIKEDAGTPLEKWDRVAYPEHPRQVLKTWYRGDRYVRICEVLPREADSDHKYKYAVHTGWLSKDKDDRQCSFTELSEAEREAELYMRLGGDERR